MHRSKRLKQRIGMNGYAEKTAVFRMIERGTRQVRATVIPNVKRETLQKKILEQVGGKRLTWVNFVCSGGGCLGID